MQLKKLISYILSCTIISTFFVPKAFADAEIFQNGINEINASKTAQWTANGKGDDSPEKYDLLISNYSANYTQTAYIGFELPEEFNPEYVQSAKLKLTTTKLENAIASSVYGADYSDFENNGKYTKSDIPTFDSTVISTIIPAEVGETAECDVTDYLKASENNVAFRIASGKGYTGWFIGSCTNGNKAPQLEIEYDNGEGAHTVPEKIEYDNGYISFDKVGSFEKGENITFTVIPNDHYILESIEINGQEINLSSDNKYEFSMPSRNVTSNYIKATFKLADYIKTRNIYEDNMILQRNKPVYIDGVCQNINLAKAYLYKNDECLQEKDVTINDDEWNVTFDAVSDYSDVYKIVIDGDNGSITMNNILFGDVFLFSGQSNMWKEVSYYASTDSDYSRGNVEKHLTDKIRVMYTKGSSCYGETNPTYDAAHKDSWRDFSTYANVSPLPAVAFSAATKLYEETGIPIGIIANAYPGSYISCWMPNTGIDACNANRNKNFNERNWYNGRIYPIRNLKLSGIFWYQGEADSATTYHSPQYDYYMDMMPKMINHWRELFVDDTLPFYYVQLCRLGDTTDVNNPNSTANGEVYIKQAQTDIAINSNNNDNIGIVGTLDIYGRYDYPQTENDANCRNDIHPGQKRLIGERLADFALKNIYGKNVFTTGPMFKSAEVNNGKVIITYNCNGKLKIMDKTQYADSVTDEEIATGEINPDELNEFEVAGTDNVWYTANADITSDNQVTVYSDKVPNPTQVRYAYSPYPEAPNLTDDSNLPSYVFMKTATVNNTDTPSDEECVKITVDYNPNGTLKNIKTEKIKKSEITPIENTAEHKVFYWNSLSDMTPVTVNNYDYNFTFGETLKDNTINVKSDMVYSDHDDGMTYGMVGVDGALMEDDSRFDGFRYTSDGVNSILKDGSDFISVDYNAYNDEVKEKIGSAEIPVRFAVKAEKNGYYTVSATAVNTSNTEETEVSMFSETRHFILFHHKLAPGESITKTFNIHLAPTYVSDKGGIREDDVINVCVTGENVGLKSVSVKKIDSAKTIYTMTDSTGADQLSNVPYSLLENYGGTGQVLSKYINPEIALSNQGEGGLDASDSLHFNNAVSNMKSGDFMYVQYGFNDASPDVYKRNLEKYYNACHEKGVKLIIVSPTDRRNISANWDSTNKIWKASNAQYSAAGKEFVDTKIANGADDIAFVDVNTSFVNWMNEVEQNILTQRNKLGFDDTEINPRAMEYYYRCGWTFGTDSVHINDAGADRASYIFAMQVKKIIEENPESVQAKVLSELMQNSAEETPYEISDTIIENGWAPNNSYPKPLSQSVEFEYPIMIKSVNSDSNKLNSMTVKVQGDMNKYAQGVGEILDENGNIIKTIYTTSTSTNAAIGHIDNTAIKYGDIITMYFDNVEIPENCSYRVYLLAIENGADKPDSNIKYSSYYTKPAEVQDRLITSSNGETSEMFDYDIDEGVSIKDQGTNSAVGAIKWQYAGSANTVKLSKETKKEMTAAHLYTNGSGTYALTKFFNGGKTISDGLVHLHFQLNHTYGYYGIKLTSSQKASSWMDGIQVLSMEDGMLKMYDGTEVGKVKSGEWTDVDVWVDLDRCTETATIAGGSKVTCAIEKLNTSDKSSITSLIPLRGFTVIYTKYPSLSPSYAFDTYITDLSINTEKTFAPQIKVATNVFDECTDMGTVSGSGNYDVHSDVTVKAVAKDGYNFVGWYKDDKLVSKDESFVIERICENISLTAKFALKHGKEDTASFEINTNKTAVKVGDTMLLTPVNPKDNDGNSIDELNAGDIEWSCNNNGIKIDTEGKLTVTDGFEIAKNTTEEITVTGKINDCVVEKKITVYSYAYYDTISESSKYNGVIKSIGEQNAALWPDERQTSVYTLDSKVNLDKNTIISYKQAWSGSNLDGKNRTISFKNSEGKNLFDITYVYHEMFSNSEKVGQLKPKDEWQEVNVNVNIASGTVTIKCDDYTTTQSIDKSILTDVSSIELTSATGVSGYASRPLGICDIIIEQ